MATVRNRRGLIAELKRAGYNTAADNVQHMCHPGNTSASLEEIAAYYVAPHRQPGAAVIIRQAIQAAEDAEQMRRDDLVNDHADAAARSIRDAAAAGAEPAQLGSMTVKLEQMSRRLDSEAGLDAEDVMTWQVRQLLLSDSHHVAALEQLTREHLAARDKCVFCNGSGKRNGVDLAHPCEHCHGVGTTKRYPHQLGEAIRDYVEESSGIGGLTEASGQAGGELVPAPEGAELYEMPEPASVLVTAALAWIDWDGLAKDQIAAAVTMMREQAERGDQRQADELRAESEKRS